jgi:hypothetical protein
LKKCEAGSLPTDLFDEAANELASMMVEGGLWGSFVWKGGCDRADEDEGKESTDSALLTELKQICVS